TLANAPSSPSETSTAILSAAGFARSANSRTFLAARSARSLHSLPPLVGAARDVSSLGSVRCSPGCLALRVTFLRRLFASGIARASALGTGASMLGPGRGRHPRVLGSPPHAGDPRARRSPTRPERSGPRAPPVDRAGRRSKTHAVAILVAAVAGVDRAARARSRSGGAPFPRGRRDPGAASRRKSRSAPRPDRPREPETPGGAD